MRRVLAIYVLSLLIVTSAIAFAADEQTVTEPDKGNVSIQTKSPSVDLNVKQVSGKMKSTSGSPVELFAVPEPTSIIAIITGLIGISGIVLRRK